MIDGNAVGQRMMSLVAELFPICRSIMGPGTRLTLDRIASEIPIERRSVPTGTKVLDWVVPDEWEIRDAYIAAAGDTHRLVDFRQCNLHVVSHSVGVNKRLTLDELQPHLHSLPDRPGLVPYRSSYYAPSWGFCLTDEQRSALMPGDYDVVIDSTLRPGELEWGELVVEGESDEEVLISTHICHPSLANDNLSGIAVAVELGRHLLAGDAPRYTHRLLFIPATIGSLAWLATADSIERIRHGLVLTGLGDSSPFTYKQSRRGGSEIDRIAAATVGPMEGAKTIPFGPYGYDERQFCSPGFDLPIGRLTRGVHGEYPEYHTSGDSLDFVSGTALCESLELVQELLRMLEANRRYVNTAPFGEPQLGRRGLYSMTGGQISQQSVELGLLWVLSGSDGVTDLCAIAELSKLPMATVVESARRLRKVGLLEPA